MRTRRNAIVRPQDLLGVTAQIPKGDAELLVRAIARRNAIGQTMRSLADWIRFHLGRDAAALDLRGEQDVRAQLARDLGLSAPAIERANGKERDARGRFLPARRAA